VNVGYTTADLVRVAARHWDSADRALGVVIAHGFTGSSRNKHVVRISRRIYESGLGVLSPDLRGHGRSGGRCTAGELEVFDVEAGVAWLRSAGYRKVAVLGWSMGGAAVLRYAGTGGEADAVVSVSAPGLWFERGTSAMRLVHWACETRSGRAVLRAGRNVRMASKWDPVPAAPSEVAGAIAPTPLLLVHGDADHYFPMRHIEALHKAAPDAAVWIEPGMAHAETGTSDELLDRLVAWLRGVTGTPPPVERGGDG
jgi:pimeloyl-ACP methyl ester carboxylesterase